ncbi:MAG: sigma-54-dependent Fis family transcriptional regulator, partial [Burkholderiales bacterium]|nr:sigma-54-dependent Fis family transcriptional regulator [Burkholderiales bacterium]
VINITIPPLRERTEDIPVLAQHFLRQLSAHLGIPPIPLTYDIVQSLQAYAWPGNARELRNLIERSLILGYFPTESLPRAAQRAADRAGKDTAPADGALMLEEVEKQHILHVLRTVDGNKSEAARRLGVSRKTLERKCALWGEE